MNRPLRVAWLSRYLPSPSETFVLDEALSMEEAGVEVLSLTLDRVRGAARHARFEGLYRDTVIVPRPSSPTALYASLVLDAHPELPALRAHWERVARLRDLRRAIWLGRHLRQSGVDVLRVHHAAETARFGVVAARLAGIPVSLAVHARDLFVPVDDFPWILSQATTITTLTPLHRERLLRAGLPFEQVSLLPCAVAVPDATARPPAPGAARLLSVGRLVPKKGHDLLLRAAAELATTRQVQLVLVGGGAEMLALRRLAGELMAASGGRLEVELLGEQSSEAVLDLMRDGGFHACVLACRVAPDGDRDGIPVSLLEAQAVGLPVVTSALPGFEWAFQDGEGARLLPLAGVRRSTDPGELPVAELARALAALVDDPELQADQAARARAAAVARPGPEVVAARLRASLLSLLPPGV